MTNAVQYLRISQDRTGEEAGVERQDKDNRLFAQAKRWTITDTYRDNDISATNGKRRPEFERLLADIEEGKVTHLVVWHLDRLTRTMRDLMRLIDAGRGVGLHIACVQGISLDLSDPTGVAVAQILTAIAGMEVAHKGNRQKLALQQRALKGQQWWARRPFGYNMDLSFNEEEAPFLRRAFDDLLNGKSSYAIAKEWNEARVRMPSTGGTWEGRRVTDLLGHPRYAGFSTYKGQIVGKGQWQPLVDEGTFYAVQSILRDPKRRTGGAPRYSLLSGVLRCGRCGKPMNRWKGKRASGTPFDRYRCPGCCFMVDTAWAEDAVVKALMAFWRDSGAEVSPNTGEALEGAQKGIQRLEERMTALADAYAEDTITLAQLQQGTAAIQKKIETLREEQQAIAEEAHTASPEELRANWDQMSVDEQRESIGRYWTLVAGYVPGTKQKHIEFVSTGVVERS